MLKSMTGYGEASCEFEGINYNVEVRTLNNRYLKTSIRLPETVVFLEDEVEKIVKANMLRGSVSLALRTKNVSSEPAFDINQELMKAYAERLTGAIFGADIDCSLNLADLLTLPGVMQSVEPDEEKALEIKKVILETVKKAVKSLVSMREIEGQALEEDLKANCDSMSETLRLIRSKAHIVVEEYRDKLQKRVDELLKDAQLSIDQQLLTREVAIFADRCDISEEMARLDSHLKQFYEICEGSESAGRRLDFLCQEMFRETNTIGSKASDAQIGQWVVDLKCNIDRIKKQVQNVEE